MNTKQEVQSESNEIDLNLNKDRAVFFLMSSSIFGLNILLMLFVSFYWLNPSFHNLITGRPL